MLVITDDGFVKALSFVKALRMDESEIVEEALDYDEERKENNSTIRKEAGMIEPTIADLKKEAWRYAEQDWRVTAGHRQKLTRKDAMRIAYYDGILRGMRIREEIKPG